MTNMEAISLLSDIRAEYRCFTDREKYHALSMGIDALRERKRGKWIGYKCSNCGYAAVIRVEHDGNVVWTSTTMNFCPSCWAKMESEEPDA